MNIKIKGIIFLVIFFTVAVTGIIIIFITSDHRSDEQQKQRLAITGNIEFKGKVINSKIYQYAGKDYYMVCVKLDTCNIKNFYVLNDICALKIKDSKATFSAGVYVPYDGIVDYVEVNVKKSGKIKYRFKNGDVGEYELVLANSGVSTEDMNVCN